MAPRNYNAPRHTNDSRIAKARMSKGWTQEQLADAIGVVYQQVGIWETGRRKPKMQTLMKIGKALGVDWKELIEDDDEA